MTKHQPSLKALLCASVLLSSAPAIAAEQIEFWFWGAPPNLQEALVSALVEPFNASQDEYELTIEFRGGVTNAIRTAVMAGEGPDLVYSAGPSEIAPFVAAGRLESLDAYAEQYGWADRLLDPVAGACKLQESYYCMPISMIAGGMFYNNALLEAKGWDVPSNEEEATAIMKAAQAEGLYASVTGNKGYQPVNANYVSLFLNNVLGPEKMYSILSGETPWTDPEAVAAIEKSKEWYEAGYLGGDDYFELNFDQSINLLSEQKAPFFYGPSLSFQWATNYFVDDKADDLSFTLFPQVGADGPVYDIGIGNSLAINAASDVKDGAAMVIDKILSPEFVKGISPEWPGFWSVPLKDFPTDESATGIVKAYYGAMSDIAGQVSEGNFGYKAETFFPPATSQVFIKGIEEVWISDRAADDLLKEAQETFEREVSEGVVQSFPKPKS